MTDYSLRCWPYQPKVARPYRGDSSRTFAGQANVSRKTGRWARRDMRAIRRLMGLGLSGEGAMAWLQMGWRA